jgi:hypothetical protein
MMKVLNCLLVFSLFCSCSKNSTLSTKKPLPKAGAISGNIKAYNKYGNEEVNHSDITIQLIDKENQVLTGSVGESGAFRFENVLIGEVTLAISKPGYGFMDTLKYDHQKDTDTLTEVDLIEELPFSFHLNSAGYSSSMFRFSGNYNYHSTDSYMVTEFLCFSKDPEVSINHTSLFWSPSAHTNVQYITGTSGGSSDLSYQTLTDAGFKTGDKIYVTVIPGIVKLWTSYYDQNKNYKILHYKIGNASNTVSFILNQ